MMMEAKLYIFPAFNNILMQYKNMVTHLLLVDCDAHVLCHALNGGLLLSHVLVVCKLRGWESVRHTNDFIL